MSKVKITKQRVAMREVTGTAHFYTRTGPTGVAGIRYKDTEHGVVQVAQAPGIMSPGEVADFIVALQAAGLYCIGREVPKEMLEHVEEVENPEAKNTNG